MKRFVLACVLGLLAARPAGAQSPEPCAPTPPPESESHVRTDKIPTEVGTVQARGTPGTTFHAGVTVESSWSAGYAGLRDSYVFVDGSPSHLRVYGVVAPWVRPTRPGYYPVTGAEFLLQTAEDHPGCARSLPPPS